MKVILRCVIAVVAVCASALFIGHKATVNAQQCCTNTYCALPPPNCPTPVCDYLGGCSYAWECDSPILMDVTGDGFHLTDQADGVSFTFFGSRKQRVSWTDPKYGNAWLALDRNGNGRIDNSSELFGNYTPQPASENKNGFKALAVYDLPENGGNGDGFITAEDNIYSHLLLWTDHNQNGISEPSELQSLKDAGISSIGLSYAKDSKIDEFGNVFRYRGRDRMNAVDYDHRVYDVYLVGTNAE